MFAEANIGRPKRLPSTNLALEIRRCHDLQTELAIWKIEESPEFFLSRVQLTARERALIEGMASSRQLQWLASRWLCRVIGLRQGSLCKDRFGKPFVIDSDGYVSISHSGHYAAVIKSDRPVGIDIQLYNEKVLNIARRFLSTEEWQEVCDRDDAITYLHVYWGAKESMYKAYGRRSLDFRRHLQVGAFDLQDALTECRLSKDDINKRYSIFWELQPDYTLTFALEQ